MTELKEKNILFELLRKFSPEEWKEFEKFAVSPFFNNGRNYETLMKIFRKHFPAFDSPELSKRKIYAKLFSGKKYKESVMYSIFSRLYAIAEEFLVYKEIQKDRFISREKYKLAGYRTKEINSRAKKIISGLDKKFRENVKSNYDFYHQKEFCKELAYYYYTINRRDKISKPVLNFLKHSFYSFLIEYFTFEVSLFTQKGFSQIDYNENYISGFIDCIDMDKVFEIIKSGDPENYAVLRAHYLNSHAFKKPTDRKVFDEFKQITFDNLKYFDTYYKKYFLNCLAMHCTLRYVAGHEEYLKEGFNIRKKTVEENLFSFNESSYISNSEFRSTFIEALNVNEVDWAEEFSEKYINLIKPEFREVLKYYAKSRIAYERGNYDKAIEYAGNVNINQITFKLDMKNLLSKIYFDTDSTESLISLLNSYGKLIKNSESANEDLLSRHSRFVKFLNKLVKFKSGISGNRDTGYLINQLSKENVTSKKWLMKKIEEMS